jgi:hypothetical protein
MGLFTTHSPSSHLPINNTTTLATITPHIRVLTLATPTVPTYPISTYYLVREQSRDTYIYSYLPTNNINTVHNYPPSRTHIYRQTTPQPTSYPPPRKKYSYSGYYSRHPLNSACTVHPQTFCSRPLCSPITYLPPQGTLMVRWTISPQRSDLILFFVYEYHRLDKVTNVVALLQGWVKFSGACLTISSVGVRTPTTTEITVFLDICCLSRTEDPYILVTSPYLVK